MSRGSQATGCGSSAKGNSTVLTGVPHVPLTALNRRGRIALRRGNGVAIGLILFAVAAAVGQEAGPVVVDPQPWGLKYRRGPWCPAAASGC